MSDDQAEIIARPPSHPIATTLIIVSMLATLLSIGLVWNELFTEYLPSKQTDRYSKAAKYHGSKSIAEKNRKDHFGADKDFSASIEEELGGKDRPLTSVVGGSN